MKHILTILLLTITSIFAEPMHLQIDDFRPTGVIARVYVDVPIQTVDRAGKPLTNHCWEKSDQYIFVLGVPQNNLLSKAFIDVDVTKTGVYNDEANSSFYGRIQGYKFNKFVTLK